jgi:hypothetical protein
VWGWILLHYFISSKHNSWMSCLKFTNKSFELCYSVLKATCQKNVSRRERERGLFWVSVRGWTRLTERMDGWMRLLHFFVQKKKKLLCYYVGDKTTFVYGCVREHQTCYTRKSALLERRDKLCIIRFREP